MNECQAVIRLLSLLNQAKAKCWCETNNDKRRQLYASITYSLDGTNKQLVLNSRKSFKRALDNHNDHK